MIGSVARSTTASPGPTAAVAHAPQPDISFVTVTFGTGPIVVDMIASLVDSLADMAISYEVIVVDNPHPTRHRRTATELSLFTAGVHVIDPATNLGFGGGCELGAFHASAPIIAFVNPDTTFEPGWLEPLLVALAGPEAPSIVAPVLRHPDGSVQECGQRLDAAGHTHANTDLDTDDVDYGSAACWVMTSDTLERLGGFDPAFHPAYFEDVDLALRARNRGAGTSIVRDSSVGHHGGQGTADAPAAATVQHRTLMRRWPQIRWQQPRVR